MLHPKAFHAALFPIAILPACSLLIDTNPDGVIDKPVAGASGKDGNGVAGTAQTAPLSGGGQSGGPGAATVTSIGGLATFGGTPTGGAGGNAVVGAGGTVPASAGSTDTGPMAGGSPATTAWSSLAGASGTKTPPVGGASSGGAPGIGGTTADFGSSNTTGGTSITGGADGGGAVAGSRTAGGTPQVGGTSAAGGTSQVGGTSATGGTDGPCAVGSVKNCTIGNLRGTQECNAEGRLRNCTPLVSVNGGHGCLVTATGNVKCWGANSNGEIGQDPTTTSKLATPTSVTTSPSALTGEVISVAVGNYHACAVVAVDATSTRTVCWGANSYGQLAVTTPTRSSRPVVIQGLTDAVAVYAGGYHSCVRTQSGQIKCWGGNDSGQIGNGTSSNSVVTPTSVLNQVGVVDMDIGISHNCVISPNHRVLCWGDDLYGQIGLNGTISSERCGGAGMPCYAEPQQVVNLSADVMEVSAGSGASCALRSTGAVHCWGNDSYHVLGTPPSSGSGSQFPTAVSGLEASAHIAVGPAQACAATQSGAVKCWGTNVLGGLGSGETAEDAVADLPVQVAGLTSGVVMVLAGDYTNCAVKGDGTLWCWGANGYYQLGIADDGIQSANVPMQLLFTP